MLIALVSEKGGVGKTTTSLMLAGALGRLGYTVEVLDCDPAQNAIAFAQRAARQPGGAPFLVEAVGIEEVKAGLLGKRSADFSIADLPGHRHDVLRPVAGSADLLISPLAPVGQEINQFHKLGYMLTIIDAARRSASMKPLSIAVLLNNMNAHRLRREAELRAALRPTRVLKTVIPTLPSLENPITDGLLPLGSQYRRPTEVYLQLAQEVIKLIQKGAGHER